MTAQFQLPVDVSPNPQFRALVVDDDPLQREAVRRRLARACVMASGTGSVHAVVGERFDLVVMRASRRETPDDIVSPVDASLRHDAARCSRSIR